MNTTYALTFCGRNSFSGFAGVVVDFAYFLANSANTLEIFCEVDFLFLDFSTVGSI